MARINYTRFIFFFRLAAILLLVCASMSQVVAQRVIVNNNGDRIIMYPDGSWRMAEPGDSVLLRQNLQKSETIGYPSDNIDPAESRNPGEDGEYILRQWNELNQNIIAQEKIVQQDFREATNAQFKASELLQNAEANKALIEPDQLAALHEEYDKSILDLKTAKSQQTEIRKIGEESKKLLGLVTEKIAKKLPPLRLKFETFLLNYIPYGSPSPIKNVPLKTEDITPIESSTQTTSQTDQQTASMESGNLGLPPSFRTKPYVSEPYHCMLIKDTVDEATGSKHIVLKPDLIFTHTDPDLRPYFKNKELITCYGRLSRIDAYVYFTIDFQIASSHSQSNFGGLESGSLLRLRLLNGKYISLSNIKSDRGHIDHYSGNTVFTGQFALGKDEMKMLAGSPLDKIRILWGTGYEDYDVYKIDFFIDQIKCLQEN